jgi:hypothetical protein
MNPASFILLDIFSQMGVFLFIDINSPLCWFHSSISNSVSADLHWSPRDIFLSLAEVMEDGDGDIEVLFIYVASFATVHQRNVSFSVATGDK